MVTVIIIERGDSINRCYAKNRSISTSGGRIRDAHGVAGKGKSRVKHVDPA